MPPETSPITTPAEVIQRLNDSFTCAICHGLFTAPVLLPCEHMFCSECIRRHLTSTSTCPQPHCKRQALLHTLVPLRELDVALAPIRGQGEKRRKGVHLSNGFDKSLVFYSRKEAGVKTRYIERLRRFGLETTGGVDVLAARDKELVIRWNANLDGGLRKNAKEVAKEVMRAERMAEREAKKRASGKRLEFFRAKKEQRTMQKQEYVPIEGDSHDVLIRKVRLAKEAMKKSQAEAVKVVEVPRSVVLPGTPRSIPPSPPSMPPSPSASEQIVQELHGADEKLSDDIPEAVLDTIPGSLNPGGVPGLLKQREDKHTKSSACETSTAPKNLVVIECSDDEQESPPSVPKHAPAIPEHNGAKRPRPRDTSIESNVLSPSAKSRKVVGGGNIRAERSDTVSAKRVRVEAPVESTNKSSLHQISEETHIPISVISKGSEKTANIRSHGDDGLVGIYGGNGMPLESRSMGKVPEKTTGKWHINGTVVHGQPRPQTPVTQTRGKRPQSDQRGNHHSMVSPFFKNGSTSRWSQKSTQPTTPATNRQVPGCNPAEMEITSASKVANHNSSKTSTPIKNLDRFARANSESPVQPPSSQLPQLTEEQKRRMERNYQIARERKLQLIERLKRQRREALGSIRQPDL